MDIRMLIERAKDKDSHALESLYEMYYPKMLGLCIKITREDEATAKDLVHDAFVLAFSSLHNLNAPERFGEWLSTITRNVALKYMERKEKVSLVSITEEDNIIDTYTTSDSPVNRNDILDLVNELPKGYGKVLKLYAIDGFSHKEIASILGIKPHSSSSQLARAKALLRKMINYKSLTVILLLIIVTPICHFILRKRQPQTQKPKIAEYDGGINKNIDTTNQNKNKAEEKDCAQKPIFKEMINANDEEKQGVMEVSDTTTVEIILPDMQIAEHEQDSTFYNDSIVSHTALPDNELAMEDVKNTSNKWQMLAVGSIGPALAQNIYKLITTDHVGDDELPSDTPLPTLPDNINTWEEYSRYLHLIGHENTPNDTLALMEIADHNNGDIVEHEQHDRPITFGISLSKPLSERWSMETGLQYSILKSRSMMGNDGYYVGKEQKIHYFGIPLRLSYRLADYKCLSIYSSAGMSLNIPVYGKVNGKYVVADTPAYTDSWHITPPIQWSANFSLGLQYQILPQLTLYLEPTIYWNIPNGSNTHTIWTEHPIMFSAPFGIRIAW